MTTFELMQRFERKFPNNGWAVAYEVGNSTGFARNRSCDAIAMQLWPSRGLDMYGFEFKVSRSDWIKELSDPSKAEEFWKRCDFWALVVGDSKIVKTGELPQGWGLLVPFKDSLKWSVKPLRNDAVEPMTRPFLASLLRAACKRQRAEEREIAVREKRAFDNGFSQGSAVVRRECDEMKSHYDEIRRDLETLNREFGINIGDRWNSCRFGDLPSVKRASRALQHFDITELQRAVEVFSPIADQLKQAFESTKNESRNGP